MTLVAHLPGYRLATGRSAEYGPGRLTHLTWEEWRQIDSDYPFQESRYDDVRPLFFQVEDAGTDQDLETFLAGTATLGYLALSMRNPATDRTPGPQMSVGYHDHGMARTRLVGPLERESIVWGYGAPTDLEPLQDEDIQAAEFLLALLSGTKDTGPMPLLLAVMESTARPDIDGPTAFVVCIAALEFALLPDERSDLRVTFAQRVATLCAENGDDWPRAERFASDLYRLRNDLTHGHVKAKTLERLGLPSSAYIGAQIGRDLVRPVLINLAGAIAAGIDPAGLPRLLDEAARSGPEWECLREKLYQGMSRYDPTI